MTERWHRRTPLWLRKYLLITALGNLIMTFTYFVVENRTEEIQFLQWMSARFKSLPGTVCANGSEIRRHRRKHKQSSKGGCKIQEISGKLCTHLTAVPLPRTDVPFHRCTNDRMVMKEKPLLGPPAHLDQIHRAIRVVLVYPGAHAQPSPSHAPLLCVLCARSGSSSSSRRGGHS